jgi:transketolase
MRITFVETLTELAAGDRRIVLLTGDLGFMALDTFIDRHPDRFFNVGVAEQNMVGLATGLAEAGFIPFIYSIVPFAVLRPFEFIRSGPVQHNLPVRIVGVGAGLEYGTNGLSHYGLDDFAATRVHHNLTVLAPADFRQTRSILLASWDRAGPIYYRLGKDQETEVSGLDGRFTWNQPTLARDGRDLLLATTSSIAAETAVVADRLNELGISAALVVVAQINPPPTAALAALMSRFPLIVTVENHFPSGGLGSMIAEIAADHAFACRVLRVGAHGEIAGRSGSVAFMHRHLGISGEQITEAIRAAWATTTK